MTEQTETGQERRRHARHEVEFEVVIGNGSRNIRARLSDISIGGAAVEWVDILETPDIATPVGNLVFVTFRTGLVVQAYVVSVAPSEIHLSFTIDDVELTAILERIRDVTGVDLSAA